MKDGINHTEAFNIIAKKLKVNYGTVSAQCTRSIGLKNTSEFKDLFEKNKLKDYLKERFPREAKKIEEEL
jgi:hypothetical protein